jgi:uncharacterized protein (TIGR02246 family)
MNEAQDARDLYGRLLDAWNRRSAGDFAALFTADGNVVGFDGSPIDGREAIRAHLEQVFADHITAAYVGKVREARALAPGVVLLRAVAGMTPPGQQELNPAVNTIQALVAVRDGGEWRIALYQNTPAQFHGRPEAVEQLTKELRQLLG